jgi:hypothetical protein
MKNINTSFVVDPLVRQPFTALSLAFLQSSRDENLAAIVKALIISNKGAYSLTAPYVISGCVVSDTFKDVTAGEIFYGGKFYTTTAVNGTTNTARFILTKTQDLTADPLTFTDSTVKNVHDIYTYVPTDVASGGDFTAIDLDSVYTTSTDYEWLNATPTVDWTVPGTVNTNVNAFQSRKNKSNDFEFRGTIKPASTFATNTILTLTGANIPYTIRKFRANILDTTKSGIITIFTDGTVDYTGSSIDVNDFLSLDNIRFSLD